MLRDQTGAIWRRKADGTQIVIRVHERDPEVLRWFEIVEGVGRAATGSLSRPWLLEFYEHVDPGPYVRDVSRTEDNGRQRGPDFRGGKARFSAAIMEHHDTPEPRRTSTLAEGLAVLAEQGQEPTRVTREAMVILDQGRTSFVLSATRQQADEALADLGLTRDAVQDWGRLSASDRLDALATWIIAVDQRAQTHRFRMTSDVMGAYLLVKVRKREVTFSDEVVEAMWVSLGHSQIAFSWTPSPAVHHGLEPAFRQAMLTRAQADREVAKYRSDDLALRHSWIRRIVTAERESA